MKRLLSSLCLCVLFVSAIPAEAARKNPAIHAYKTAMAEMHRHMNVHYSGDPDTDFVRGMIPHHQGAIDMANVILKYGDDANMKALAEWIIYMQEQEIGFMKHWLRTRGVDVNTDRNAAESEATVQLKEAGQRMHQHMNIAYSGDADVDFARGMIPHHQGAIDMAKILLKHGNNLELRELAEDIVASQGQEIARMEKWLATQNYTLKAQPKTHTSHQHH